jgi:hypothetical protein
MHDAWDEFDLEPLAEELRRSRDPVDAERMIWAFERALRVGRVEQRMLEYLLAASVCLLAGAEGESPRDVLDRFFRRSIPDHIWQERYQPLFA